MKVKARQHYLLYAVSILALVFGCLFWISAHSDTTPDGLPVIQKPMRTVVLDGQTIRVTVVDTDATREKGLGGRSGLEPDEGMLFVFDHDDRYAFWMKDMRFSIDIVWISSEGKIVYIQHNVEPATYPADFVPTAPARYVLELPSGYTEAYNVKIGDVVGM